MVGEDAEVWLDTDRPRRRRLLMSAAIVGGSRTVSRTSSTAWAWEIHWSTTRYKQASWAALSTSPA